MGQGVVARLARWFVACVATLQRIQATRIDNSRKQRIYLALDVCTPKVHE